MNQYKSALSNALVSNHNFKIQLFLLDIRIKNMESIEKILQDLHSSVLPIGSSAYGNFR